MIKFIKKLLHIRIVRFFLVAGLNTLFGVSMYSLLLLCFNNWDYFETWQFNEFNYAIAAFLGQIISVLFNFKTYGALVFKNKSNKLVFRFVGVYLILYLCNVSGIWVFKQLYPTNDYIDYIAAVMLVIPIGFLGYILNKTFVFHTKSQLTFEEDPDDEITN